MVRCPKCNEEIGYLIERREAETRCRLLLDERGDSHRLYREQIYDSFPVTEYQCPRCRHVTCSDECVAIALLQGKEIVPVVDSW